MPSNLMFDAAYAIDIPAQPDDAVVSGYLYGGDPLHPWADSDWRKFPGRRKLPILTRSDPANKSEAEDDAFQALRDLYAIGARHCLVALDIETAKDAAYVEKFGHVMNFYDYLVLAYGSQGNIFSVPMLDGRWVAAPGKTFADFPRRDDIRAIQNVQGEKYDSSILRAFLSDFGHWWK